MPGGVVQSGVVPGDVAQDGVVPGGIGELILGGARSGKSRAAERRAADWLGAAASHRATLVATAWAGDDEMAARIARHRADRARRVPALDVIEAPVALGDALDRIDGRDRLVIVDCLTLWVAQCLMPPERAMPPAAAGWPAERAGLLDALQRLQARGAHTVLVSNEIGLGVLPVSAAARACVDELGRLHQDVAARATRVTLMVAGLPLRLK